MFTMNSSDVEENLKKPPVPPVRKKNRKIIQNYNSDDSNWSEQNECLKTNSKLSLENLSTSESTNNFTPLFFTLEDYEIVMKPQKQFAKKMYIDNRNTLEHFLKSMIHTNNTNTFSNNEILKMKNEQETLRTVHILDNSDNGLLKDDVTCNNNQYDNVNMVKSPQSKHLHDFNDPIEIAKGRKRNCNSNKNIKDQPKPINVENNTEINCSYINWDINGDTHNKTDETNICRKLNRTKCFDMIITNSEKVPHTLFYEETDCFKHVTPKSILKLRDKKVSSIDKVNVKISLDGAKNEKCSSVLCNNKKETLTNSKETINTSFVQYYDVETKRQSGTFGIKLEPRITNKKMAKITEIESNDPPEKNQNNADAKRSGSFLNFAKRIPAIKLWYRDSTNRQEQNIENQNIKLDSKLLSSSDCDEAERQGAVKKTINDFDKKQTKRKNSFVKRLKNYVCDLDTKPNFYVDLEDNVTEECNYGYVVEEPVTPICGSSTVTSLCDSVEEIFDENDSVNSSVYIASESEVLLIFPNKKETAVDQSPTCSENGEKYVVDLNTDEDISNALKSNIDENRTRECSTYENIIITDIGKDFRISISVEDISQIKSNFGIENSNNESLVYLNAATEVTNNDQIKICEKNLCGESISLDNNASDFEINYSNQKHGHGNVKSYKNVGINDNLCKQNITGDAKEELIINHKHAYSLDDPCLQTSINNNRKWIKVNNEGTKKNVNFNNKNCFLYEKENGLIEDMKRNANLKKCFSLNVKSDNSKVKCKKIPSFYNSVRSARFHRNAEEDIFKNETREGDRVVGINNQPADRLAQARRSLQAAPDLVLLRLVRQLAAPGCHGGATGVTVPGAMGANVSRHTGKGLSGRRTQSSGNICNGNKAPQVSKLLGSCASGSNQSDNNKQRRRFCGSLPNHLDGTEENTECDSVCYVKENNNHAPPTPPVATVSATVVVGGKKYPAPPPPSQRYVSAPTPPHVPITGNGNVKYHQPLTLKVAAGSDTALCDQGYGSERSPEDENPPPGHSGSEPGTDEGDIYAKYPFITPEATFTVFLTRGGRGLGLSVGGGADVTGPWPGLVRVKRLFPNQPASLCGFLAPGDLLLEANGVKLTGLTNYEALEVLRTLPANVVLTVCRPPQEVLSAVSPLSDVPPPPPRRDPPCSLNLLPPLAPTDEPYCGEFDVTLAKVQGSLGFTLRKEDESALGHYIRALVREPALSDGRVKPGDKIVAVNDVELSSFSHEQAVQFLRQCGNEVKLRLYRDSSQTPVAALSPTDPDPPQRLKPLRQEAMDMLSDLAVRKLSPGASGDSSWSRSGGNRSLSPPGESPRRLRKNQQRSTPDSECENSIYTDEKGLVKIYTTSSQVTSESDSLSRKASLGSDHASGNLSSIESENDKPIRPNFLNLCSPVLTPTRKPKFQFSLAHNAYELNNLDAEVLDAPNIQYTLKTGQDVVDSSSPGHGCNIPEEPASMPPISTTAFSYKNPVYQSAHPQCGSEHVNEPNSDGSKSDNGETKVDGSKGLLKWKGVVFSPEGSSDDTVVLDAGQSSNNENIDSDLDTITVELNRGWNCRLGFSLQQHSTGGTYISAVHADSVAAKDGRLKMGDILLKVNDEDISSLPTNDVIDLLRIVRGPVSIVVGRNNNVAL